MENNNSLKEAQFHHALHRAQVALIQFNHKLDGGRRFRWDEFPPALERILRELFEAPAPESEKLLALREELAGQLVIALYAARRGSRRGALAFLRLVD